MLHTLSCTTANTITRLWLSIALVCVLCFSHSRVFALSEDEQAAKLKQLRETMEQLQKELDKTKDSRESLLKDLEKSEKSAGELNQKAKELEDKLEQRQDNLNGLEDERSQLNLKKKNQQQQVSQYINSAYRSGKQSQLRLLLNQEDPSTVSRNLKYYQYLIAARREKIQEFSTTIGRLDQIEPEMQYQRDQVQQEMAKLKLKRRNLQVAQQQRKSTLAKLTASISSQAQELANINKDRERLGKVIAQVSSYIKDTESVPHDTPFSKMKGKLPWPTKGIVNKRFGNSRMNRQLKWQGLLISSNGGTPVKAVHHGQVVFSDYLRGHGMLIIIDHGKDYLTLYAHNRAIYKALGEWVEPGEVIATVGDSGGLSQDALYFEVRHKGKPVNPKFWLSRSA